MFGLNRGQRARRSDVETIDDRFRTAIYAWEDARGVVRNGLNAQQWRRQRFMCRAAEAGLDHLRLVYVAYLIEQGRLSDG